MPLPTLSTEAQALFDHARQSLPRWLTSADKQALEWLLAFAAVFDDVREIGQEWLDSTYLTYAAAEELDQHAADRGTSRRLSESDPILRGRLTVISDTTTQPVLTSNIDIILDTASQPAYWRSKHYVNNGWTLDLQTRPGIGSGAYSVTVRFAQVLSGPVTVTQVGKAVTVSYIAGTHTRAQIEAAINAQSTLIQVKTASGTPGSTVIGVASGLTMPFYMSKIFSLRLQGAHAEPVGSAHAFFSNGYRFTNVPPVLAYVVILPYPTTEASVRAIQEYLRLNGPSGFLPIVERRVNP